MRLLRVCSMALLVGCASSAAPDSSAVATSAPVVPVASADASPRSGIRSTVTSADAPGHVVEITYDDVRGVPRTIQAELRLPERRAVAPTPVVTWSHGGSRGFRNVANVGERWGRAMNADGFAFVAIAHTGRSESERLAVCDAIGGSDCERFNPLQWDRPHDVAVVLDWIESIAVAEDLDAHRIVHGGHSAGALGALLVSGAGWTFDAASAPPSDPRPIGFIAASPPGAESHAFSAPALAGINRPILFATGLGDETSSTTGLDRRATFDLLPDEVEAVLLWVDRAEARHGLFDLNRASCERAGGTATACRNGARAIAATGTRFVAAVADAADSFDARRFAETLTPRLPAAMELTVDAG